MKRCADCKFAAVRHKERWWKKPEPVYYCILADVRNSPSGTKFIIDKDRIGGGWHKRHRDDCCIWFNPAEDPLKSHLEKCLEMEVKE